MIRLSQGSVQDERRSSPWREGGGADGPHGFGESGNPGGYFHLSPGEVYIGGGMWHPPTAKLTAFRAAVADDPKAIRRLIDEPRFVSTFGPISGEKLKRVPSGFQSDHPEAELLKQKDLTFGRRLADDDVMGPQLVTSSPTHSSSPFRSCAGSLGCSAPVQRSRASICSQWTSSWSVRLRT